MPYKALMRLVLILRSIPLHRRRSAANVSAGRLLCPLQGIALGLIVLAQFQGHGPFAEVQGSMEVPQLGAGLDTPLETGHALQHPAVLVRKGRLKIRQVAQGQVHGGRTVLPLSALSLDLGVQVVCHRFHRIGHTRLALEGAAQILQRGFRPAEGRLAVTRQQIYQDVLYRLADGFLSLPRKTSL